MPPPHRSPVGAHVFVAGGLARTGLAYARQIGAEAVQVFVSNPRGWAPAPGDRAQDAAFVSGCAQDGLPVFVHAPYLVNLASPTEATGTNSVAALRHAVRRSRQIEARGGVVHAGCRFVNDEPATAIGRVCDRLCALLDE